MDKDPKCFKPGCVGTMKQFYTMPGEGGLRLYQCQVCFSTANENSPSFAIQEEAVSPPEQASI